jgi:hypothetical protein
MGKLKLTVNEEKTQICKVPEGKFNGLHVRADVFVENRKSLSRLPAIEEERQAHSGNHPRAHCPIGDMARYHKAGAEVEPHAARA